MSKLRNSLGCLWSILISLAILSAAGYSLYFILLRNPCDLPVKYSIGNIDSRFKITKEEVEIVSKEASQKWNQAVGEEVLQFDPQGRVKIELIYDERQAKLDKITAQSGQLDSSGNSIQSLRSRVEKVADQYEKDFREYSAKVDYWNNLGGAPPKDYNELQQQKEALEQRRQAINESADLLNQKIDEHNTNLDQFNTELEADQDKLITEGVYSPKDSKISIFTFGNKDELRLLIVHELGHALTLGHVNDPTSILYPVLLKQNLEDPIPTEEDRGLFQNACRSREGAWQNIIRRFRSTDQIS